MNKNIGEDTRNTIRKIKKICTSQRRERHLLGKEKGKKLTKKRGSRVEKCKTQENDKK
jgi:hypothetical protein